MKKNEKGFTLAELLVVVLIIGVLTALSIPQYTKAVERARATEAMSLVKNINEAVYTYAAERTGAAACPTSFRKLSITLPVEDDNSSSIDLENFRFVLGGATAAIIPGTSCPGVTAVRINGGEYDYVIWNPYRARTSSSRGATLACYSPLSKENSIDVCKSLGLYTEGAKPTP
jgi:type IV pilus assembly protein PilE